jgi:hypothetical protein
MPARMSGRGRGSSETTRTWTRRACLKATLLGAGALGLRVPASGADQPDEAKAEVLARAEKAGLGAFRSSISEHYLGIGDAPDDFRAAALKRCEALATAYQKHFQEKKFPVSFPARRLTVVTLKDRPTYARFLGEAPGEDVGGHYDLDTNQLVMFDFRPGKGEDKGAAVAPERLNTITLVHEATHQLTFNTGLLDRQADVPLALSEGLAMYAELWRPGPRSVLGATNVPRLQVFITRTEPPVAWIPVEMLLTDDALFQGVNEQVAYAEGWVLVHYLLKTPAMLPKFRAYLDAIRLRRDPLQRLADARAHLGDLDRLDGELRKHASGLIRGRR